MNILITGQNSYIGTSFETWAKQQNPDWVIDTIDVRGEEWKNKSFSGYDVLINVAGIAHIKAKDIDSNLYYKVNRDLALSIAKKAKEEGVAQFIQLSSMSVYGINGKLRKPLVITKQTQTMPTTDYGKSKCEADRLLDKLRDVNFIVTIVRPPMVYGPGCLGNYVTLSKAVKKYKIFPVLKNERSMIYIDNLSEIICQSIKQKNVGIIHPQNSSYISTLEMVRAIAHTNNIKIYESKLLGFIILLFGDFVPVTKKVFGNLTYDKNDSDFVVSEKNQLEFNQTIAVIEEKR